MKYSKTILKENYYWEFKPFYDSLPDELEAPTNIISKVNTQTTTEAEMVKNQEYFTKEQAFGLVCKIISENDKENKYNLIWFKDDKGGLCRVFVFLVGDGWLVYVFDFDASDEWFAGYRSFFRNRKLDTSETLYCECKRCECCKKIIKN